MSENIKNACTAHASMGAAEACPHCIEQAPLIGLDTQPAKANKALEKNYVAFLATCSDFVDDATSIANAAIKNADQPEKIWGQGHAVLHLSSDTDTLIRSQVFGGIWGLCAIVGGVTMLLDHDHPNRDTFTYKFKAYSAIISGIGITISTGIAVAAIPVYMAGSILSLLNGTIDLIKADKKTTFPGWLDEQEKEILFLSKRISEETNSDKKETLKTGLKKKIQEAQSRCRAQLHPDSGSRASDQDMFRVETFAETIDAACKQVRVRFDLTSCSKQDKEESDKIIHAAHKGFRKAQIDLAQKVVSFTGMVLLTIAVYVNPVTGPAAAIISSIVACYLLARLAHKIYQLSIEHSSVGNNINSLQHHAKGKPGDDFYPSSKPHPDSSL